MKRGPVRQNSALAAFFLTFLAFFLSGCLDGPSPENGSSGEQKKGNMNQEQAEERVEEHVRRATSALPSSVDLEAREGTITAACDDPTDDGPKDRVTVSRTYVLNGFPVEDNEETIEILHNYWSNNEYDIISDRRPGQISVSAEHNEDAFTVFVRSSKQGTLSLGSSSPCVQRDGAS